MKKQNLISFLLFIYVIISCSPAKVASTEEEDIKFSYVIANPLRNRYPVILISYGDKSPEALLTNKVLKEGDEITITVRDKERLHLIYRLSPNERAGINFDPALIDTTIIMDKAQAKTNLSFSRHEQIIRGEKYQGFVFINKTGQSIDGRMYCDGGKGKQLGGNIYLYPENTDIKGYLAGFVKTSECEKCEKAVLHWFSVGTNESGDIPVWNKPPSQNSPYLNFTYYHDITISK